MRNHLELYVFQMSNFLIIILIIFIALLLDYFEELFIELLWLLYKLMLVGMIVLLGWGLYAFLEVYAFQ